MEPTAPAAAVATQAAPAQPAAFTVPDGKQLVDIAEYQRHQEQLRGSKSFVEAAGKHGLKRPEDFERVARFNKFEDGLKGRGLTMDQIEQAFTAQEQERQEGGGTDVATLEKHFGEKFVPAEKFTQELDRRDAMRDHKSASEREQSLLKSAVSELAGENASTRDKWLIENSVKAVLDEHRQMYPAGHPLHETHLAALDEKGIAALVEKVKKEIAVSDGADMAAIGKKAAASKPVATPAGNKAPPGKAEDNTNQSPRAQIKSAVEQAMGGRG